MIAPPVVLEAALWSRLPDALHWRGGPNAWTEAARPGQRLHSFLEGPAFDGEDALIVDVPYGRIFRLTPAGDWSVALSYDGQPHAIKRLPDGDWAIACFQRGLLGADLATGLVTDLQTEANTEAFRGLSDLAVAPNGDVWFTDSGRSSLTDPAGRLFVRRADGRLETALGGLPYPNGVALSPDGGQVYVAMTRAQEVRTLRADWPRVAPPMSGVFTRTAGGLGPDGLATDAAGRLACAQAQAGRVHVWSRLGDPLAVVRLPEGLWTTAVAFAPDGALIITEAQRGAVWRADLASLPSEL
ncbi:MAG: SMP-30/gluconolactonase/LRE family protein [Pseudomonadota bacterium]